MILIGKTKIHKLLWSITANCLTMLFAQNYYSLLGLLVLRYQWKLRPGSRYPVADSQLVGISEIAVDVRKSGVKTWLGWGHWNYFCFWLCFKTEKTKLTLFYFCGKVACSIVFFFFSLNHKLWNLNFLEFQTIETWDSGSHCCLKILRLQLLYDTK